MREILDRLTASITSIDNAIHRQRRALATVAAVSNMSDLETARNHVRAAIATLTHFQGDALPSEASLATSQTPTPPPAGVRP